MSRALDLQTEVVLRMLEDDGYRRVASSIRIDDWALDVAPGALLLGPANSDSLVVVDRADADRLEWIGRRLRVVLQALERSDSQRTLSLVLLVDGDLTLRQREPLFQLCRTCVIGRDADTERTRALLSPLLTIALPAPLDGGETVRGRLRAQLQTELDDGGLASALLGAAESGAADVERIVFEAIKRAIAADTETP